MAAAIPNIDDIEIELPGVRLNRKIPERKIKYGIKMKALLAEYSTCLIVTIDNIGSKQINQMRKDFRGRARFLFGKNTLMRKMIRDYVKESGNKEYMSLMDAVKGNCGFVFTKEAPAALRKEILARKRQAAAKAGIVAPADVYVPAGPTGMEPTQTSFFQAMNIPTRINRGQIDIEEAVHIVKMGEKVGPSEASLLSKLGIKPFFYGMKVVKIYANGEVIDASVLDITTEQIAQSFSIGLRQVSALCFSLNYPTIVNVPHSLLRAYKNVLSLGLQLDGYSWEGLATVKMILENPGAFAAASGGGGGGGGGAGDAGAGGAAPAEKEKSPTPESSAAPAGGMFGDDSSSDEDSSE